VNPTLNFFYLSIFRIIDLGENYRQIFGSTGLIRKILRNKDLAPKNGLKILWGSFEVRPRRTYLKAAPIKFYFLAALVESQ
jgi:hypothetical protein